MSPVLARSRKNVAQSGGVPLQMALFAPLISAAAVHLKGKTMRSAASNSNLNALASAAASSRAPVFRDHVGLRASSGVSGRRAVSSNPAPRLPGSVGSNVALRSNNVASGHVLESNPVSRRQERQLQGLRLGASALRRSCRAAVSRGAASGPPSVLAVQLPTCGRQGGSSAHLWDARQVSARRSSSVALGLAIVSNNFSRGVTLRERRAGTKHAR